MNASGKVWITAEQNANVTVSIPSTGFNVNLNIPAGSTDSVDFNNTNLPTFVSEVLQNHGIHIVSNVDISVWVYYPSNANADGTLILPVSSQGKNYVATSYMEYANGGSNANTRMAITCACDSTLVEIVPTFNTHGGTAAGTPIQVWMDEGQTFQLHSNNFGVATATKEMTGTTISAISSPCCNPLNVLTGTSAEYIYPVGGNGCCADQMMTQLYPMERLGKTYYALPFDEPPYTLFRVTSVYNNTDVFVDGVYQTTLSANSYWDLIDSNGHIFTSNKRFQMTQFCPSDSEDGTTGNGDPMMMMVSPIGMEIDSISFQTWEGFPAQNYLLMVIRKNAAADVRLDGLSIVDSFKTFLPDTNFVFADVEINRGFHRVTSPVKFQGYVYELRQQGSYSFPLGGTRSVVNGLTEIDICDSNHIVTAEHFDSVFWYDDPSNTLLKLQIPFSYFDGSSSLVRLDYWNDGCLFQEWYPVTAGGGGTIELINDTSICANDTVILNIDTSGGWQVVWQDGSTNPTYYVVDSGQYWINMTNGQCSTADTVNVDLFDPDFLETGFEDTTLCPGDSLWLAPINNGFTLQWSDGSQGDSLLVTQSGEYWVQIPMNGCPAIDTFSVNFVPPSMLDLGPDTTLCIGDSIQLNADTSGGWNVSWNIGGTSPSVWVADSGQVIAQQTNGTCSTSDSVLISVIDPSLLDLGPDTNVCEGSAVLLSVDPSWTSVLWSDGSQGNSLMVTDSGTYWVSISNSVCPISDTIQIGWLSLPKPDLGPDTTICSPDSFLLASNPAWANFTWSNNAVIPTQYVSNFRFVLDRILEYGLYKSEIQL